MTNLKTGYTTGVHTSFVFKHALNSFLATRLHSISKTNKMDNDDLDVTKGCEIIASISNSKNDLKISKIPHKPYTIHHKDSLIKIYAGDGLGIVTKDGIKPPKNYPAINPKPLQALKDIFISSDIKKLKLFCVISITDGENIAKKTANKKVGIVGGISILGSTGFVKPISNSSYIKSIETELVFAKTNNYKKIIFTLGNTAYTKATKQDQNYLIEIGNFIYDGIKLAIKLGFKGIELWLGGAKAIKVSQGFKNTHNRFGDIDFELLQKELPFDIKGKTTIKAIKESLNDKKDFFKKYTKHKAEKQLKTWFKRDIKVVIC